MALLNSGFNIEDPTVFADSLQKLINTGFGLQRDQPVEEIAVEVEEDKKEEAETKEEEEVPLEEGEKENPEQAEKKDEPETQEIPLETKTESGEGSHDDL
jgi:hypothetical protein